MTDSDHRSSKQWRERMQTDVLPELNRIGKHLAGAILAPTDPDAPTETERAITRAADKLLDLGTHFLTRCLDSRISESRSHTYDLELFTEKEIMDHLVERTGRQIILGVEEQPNREP